jgi:hypothetical protein
MEKMRSEREGDNGEERSLKREGRKSEERG